jgi:hypothetical protein
MRYFLLSKLLISIALIIFNQIILSNCESFFDTKIIFIEDKLYCSDPSHFFYVDLANISLDTDELVKKSKWINLMNIKPQPDNLRFGHPIPAGNKIMFLQQFAGNSYVNIFDTILKKWDINHYVNNTQPEKNIFELTNWITDEKTGKSYLAPTIFEENMVIFDTINMVINSSASGPKVLAKDPASIGSYNKYAQVLVPNGQILFIGGRVDYRINLSLDNLLVYDTVNDTWQTTVF